MTSEVKRFKYEDAALFKIALSIREAVFVKEQGVDKDIEFDGRDKYSTHYLLFYEGGPIATARWRETETGIKLGRFAVLPEYRNKGIGKIILDNVMKDVLKLPGKIYLHAQEKAMNFYLKNGFVIEGDMFVEAGIRHFKMIYKIPG
ncbi:MAG: GNAT family N-acetyltransferase [Bacteroidia bacterium]|nr:GNAT family N-acetyltransferase [Bacteroidia bacterium]